MQGQALPGFRDFYPEELALRNHIFTTWRDVARRHGFQEYDGPPLEPLELYTGKSGEEIVQQLYAIEDKGGRVQLLHDLLAALDRKSTRLNSSHRCISYAVFCLKQKKHKRLKLLTSSC